MDNDVRPSTKSLYGSRNRAFARYCSGLGVDTATCHPNVLANFLTSLIREKKMAYQTLCGYRSAISKQHEGVNGVPIGQLAMIKKLIRAVFIESPPLPRYSQIWDVD